MVANPEVEIYWISLLYQFKMLKILPCMKKIFELELPLTKKQFETLFNETNGAY